MSRLDVGIRQLENDVTVLDLKGFVDRHTVTTLDSALKGLIEKGQTRILINCGELGYLSSAGIGVFMSQLIKVNKSGGTLKFCAMNRHVKTLMDVAGFSKVLEIYDTEKQALARFASAPSTASAATPEDDGEALRIAVREDPSQKIASLTLHGDVDRHTLAILETELTRLLEASFTKLVVSCEGVTFLSSASAACETTRSPS
ncbi:MAG: STAS domain-containing protein [Planctomycetota bacterium]|jgi:anti-sigma B factor antagonist